MSSAVYKRSDGAIFAEVGGDIVALHVQRGQCYGLEKVSAEVWKMLDAPISVDAMCAELIDQYDVEPEVCRSEVERLLDQLQSEGLVERLDLAERPAG